MNYLKISSLCIILLFLAGCAGYRARPLKKLNTGISTGSKEQSIGFAYHVFDKRDCKNYLDRDVLKEGYQPIHITIVNNTKKRYRLDMNSFSMTIVNPEDVAQRVHTSTVSRAAGYGIPGIFFWPLLIPAVIDSVKSVEANNRLDADFDHKTLQSQEIAPYSSLNGLIFVPIDNFEIPFSFAMVDVETSERISLSTHRVALLV